MRVLLDHNVNPRFARLISGHEVIHAQRMGWEELLNGDLISAAESEGVDMSVTVNKKLHYQ